MYLPSTLKLVCYYCIALFLCLPCISLSPQPPDFPLIPRPPDFPLIPWPPTSRFFPHSPAPNLQIFPSFPAPQLPDFSLIPRPPASIRFFPHIHNNKEVEEQYQMWQSQVEIKHHFVACFDRITACMPRAATQYFRYKAHTCCVNS